MVIKNDELLAKLIEYTKLNYMHIQLMSCTLVVNNGANKKVAFVCIVFYLRPVIHSVILIGISTRGIIHHFTFLQTLETKNRCLSSYLRNTNLLSFHFVTRAILLQI